MQIPRPLFLPVLVSILFVSSIGIGTHAQEQTSALRVEGLSAYVARAGSSTDLTISFRIVNAGGSKAKAFRTRIAGKYDLRELTPVNVSASGLDADQTLYVSQTFTLPNDAKQFSIRVEADIDGTVDVGLAPITVVAVGPIFPPVPGQWVSIGPRRITAPAEPSFGLGPFDATGRLGPIAVHPANPQIIFVGSPGELGHEGCGVWRTLNGGKTWQPIAAIPTLAIAAIAFDPSSPYSVYVVSVDNGLFRSDDGGTSWLHVNTSDLNVRRDLNSDWASLIVSPADPQVLYLSTDTGILRSGDGGMSWATSLSGLATAVVIDPRDPDVLYAALQADGIYRTSNGGTCGNACWSKEALPGVNFSPQNGILLALSRPTSQSPETVYAIVGAPASADGYSLLRRDADGAWASRFTCDPTPGAIRLSQFHRPHRAIDCRFLVLAADPANPDTVYMAGPGLAVSGDGGANFVRVPNPGLEDRQPHGPHGDFHGMAFDPVNSHIIYGATDGGIYRSSDRGIVNTWSFIGEGITNTEIYDLSHAPTFLSRTIAGTQDNGTILTDGSPTWDHVFPVPIPPPPPNKCEGCGGDGATVAIDPANANIHYAMGQYQNSLVKLDHSAATFVDFDTGLPLANTCATFNATFNFHVGPPGSGLLLASCNVLYRTLAATANGDWKIIFTPSSGQVVRSAIDASILLYYAGTSDGHLHAGPQGANWQDVFTHPAGLSVSDIEVDPSHPENVYVSFALGPTVGRDCNAVGGRIFRLRRGTAAPTTMFALDITGDLPGGECVNALAIDPNVPSTLYAATSKGVYRGRPTGGTTTRSTTWLWEKYMNGLPPADVRDLELVGKDRMRAGTYGRGAYEVIILGIQRLP